MIWYKDYVILWIIFGVFVLITVMAIIPISYVVGHEEGIEVGKKEVYAQAIIDNQGEYYLNKKGEISFKFK